MSGTGGGLIREHGTWRTGEPDENEARQVSTVLASSNPVALMSRMEAELNDIRRLAIYRGRYYQSAIRRLDYLEEALLAMFETRLQLMESIILRPRFATASHDVVVASPQGRRLLAQVQMRDLEENVHFLKNRVRILQRRMNHVDFPRREELPGPSRTEGSVQTQDETPGYAEIIWRELNKAMQDAEGGTKVSNQANAKHSISIVKPRKSRSVPNKRSKFTC